VCGCVCVCVCVGVCVVCMCVWFTFRNPVNPRESDGVKAALWY